MQVSGSTSADLQTEPLSCLVVYAYPTPFRCRHRHQSAYAFCRNKKSRKRCSTRAKRRVLALHTERLCNALQQHPVSSTREAGADLPHVVYKLTLESTMNTSLMTEVGSHTVSSSNIQSVVTAPRRSTRPHPNIGTGISVRRLPWAWSGASFGAHAFVLPEEIGPKEEPGLYPLALNLSYL